MSTTKQAWITYRRGQYIECRSREHAIETADAQMIETGEYWAVSLAEWTAEGWLLIPATRGRQRGEMR